MVLVVLPPIGFGVGFLLEGDFDFVGNGCLAGLDIGLVEEAEFDVLVDVDPNRVLISR